MSIRGQLITNQQQQQQSAATPPSPMVVEHHLQQQQHQQPQTPQPHANNPLTSSFKLNNGLGTMGGSGANNNNNGMVMMQKSVAIVTPQRSNSMDYLNFEERRQLIASSLSLSEILANGGQPAKESVANAGLGNFIAPGCVSLFPQLSQTSSVQQFISLATALVNS